MAVYNVPPLSNFTNRAKTYSAVVTAQAANVAFQIEVSRVGTIVLERSINGTTWVVDRSIEDMFVYSNVAEFNGFAATVAFGECDITIEQLPTSKLTDLSGNGHHLYLYGFTGSDNIVDNMLQHTGTQYGVSYGQPILTDYTVCSTREWINPANDNVFASKSSAPGNGAFIFEYIPNSTYSFGTETIAAYTVPNGFSYQTKTSYNGIRALTVGTGLDTDHLVVGRIRLKDQPRSFHGGYKSFVLFNRTLTTEELAYVERWMA